MPSFLTEFFVLMNSFNFQIFDFADYIQKFLDIPKSEYPYKDNFDTMGYSSCNVILNAFDVAVFLA